LTDRRTAVTKAGRPAVTVRTAINERDNTRLASVTGDSPTTDRRPSSLAWAVWGLGALFFSLAFFHRVAPAVMVDGLMSEFRVGGAVLGNLAAIYFYAYAGLQLPVGMVIDRWGPRRVLTAAAAVCALGTLLFAMAGSLGAAYAGRFLVGASVAFPFVGSLTLATLWFPPRRFALLTGLTMFAGMAGGILGQAPLATLVEAIGWRTAMAAAAAVSLLISVLVWLVVRDRPESTAQNPAQPEPAKSGMAMGLRAVLGRGQSWIIAGFAASMAGPMFAFAGLWGVPYLMRAFGLERPGAALTVSAMMVGWALGAPATGWISDHLGRRRAPMIGGAVVALLSILTLLYATQLSLVAVAALLFLNGFAGGAMSVCFAIAREHNPEHATGVAIAFVNAINLGGGALLQPLIGLVLDLNWDGATEAGARIYSTAAYDAALAVLPASYAIAIVLGLLIRETWCRPVD